MPVLFRDVVEERGAVDPIPRPRRRQGEQRAGVADMVIGLRQEFEIERARHLALERASEDRNGEKFGARRVGIGQQAIMEGHAPGLPG